MTMPANPRFEKSEADIESCYELKIVKKSYGLTRKGVFAGFLRNGKKFKFSLRMKERLKWTKWGN